MPSLLKRKRIKSDPIKSGSSTRLERSLQSGSFPEIASANESLHTSVSVNLSSLYLRNDCLSMKEPLDDPEVTTLTCLTKDVDSQTSHLDGSLERPTKQDQDAPASLNISNEGPAFVERVRGVKFSISGPSNTPFGESSNQDSVVSLANPSEACTAYETALSIASDQISANEELTFSNTPDSSEMRGSMTCMDLVEDGVRLYPPTMTSDLVWSDSEITAYDPDDPDDDGYGVNGIGFKPSASIAERRRLRRQKQISEWSRREDIEKRIRRRERRTKPRSDLVVGQDQLVETQQPSCKKVRFLVDS